MTADPIRSGGRKEYRISLLVKFFSEREHADAFQDGLLYARRLKHFREEEDPQRKDEHEGTIPEGEAGDQVLLVPQTAGGKAISLTLTEPAQQTYSSLDDLNIFCMTNFLSSPGYGATQEMLDEVHRQVDDSLSLCMELGSHAVVVEDPVQFVARVRQAATAHEYDSLPASVVYYDTYPQDATTLEGGLQWRHALLKSRRYAKQREYRFIFNTRVHGDAPLELRVGTLRNITKYTETRDLADRSRWPSLPPASNL